MPRITVWDRIYFRLMINIHPVYGIIDFVQLGSTLRPLVTDYQRHGKVGIFDWAKPNDRTCFICRFGLVG